MRCRCCASWRSSEHKLHLDIQFCGSVDALAALNAGRCLLAGFHALTDSPPRSPTARTYRPLLKPGPPQAGELCAAHAGPDRRAGQPARRCAASPTCRGPACASRPARRRAPARAWCSSELLAAQHIDPAGLFALERTEPSHRAAAEAVASGSADAAFGIEAAARARGLDFVPLAREQYFLVALQPSLDSSPRSQRCSSCCAARPGRQQLECAAGLCRRSQRRGAVAAPRAALVALPQAQDMSRTCGCALRAGHAGRRYPPPRCMYRSK